jgi:hypothetical protein
MKKSFLLLTLVSSVFVACGTKPNSDESVDSGLTQKDADRDGFGEDVDCDDSDATVNPDADEVCDGIDNNCDDSIDGEDAVDARTLYADMDDDGYGDPESPSTACEHEGAWVADNTDCSDMDRFVNPGATELCDDVDNDCDPATTENGLVSYFLEGAGVDNLSPLFLGANETTPVQFLADQAGEVRFCSGTYFLNMEIAENVSVVGTGDGPGDVVFDGGENGAVIKILTSEVDFSIRNLTIQNGSGATTDNSSTFGGGISCQVESTNGDQVTGTLHGLIVSENTADAGGGVAVFGCALDVSNTTIIENYAEVGGGLVVLNFGGLTMSDVDIQGNVATDGAGGVYYSSLNFSDTLEVVLDDVTLDDNTSDAFGAGWFAGADLIWTSTSNTKAGMRGNYSGDGGALGILFGDLETTNVDFGISGTADNNQPFDLEYNGLGSDYNLQDDMSMSCETDGICGTKTDFELIDQTQAASFEIVPGRLHGAVFWSDLSGTIEDIEAGVYLDSTKNAGTCSVSPVLLSTSTTLTHGKSSSWDVLFVGNEETVDTDPTVNLHFGQLIEAGRYYALAYFVECSSSTDRFKVDISLSNTAPSPLRLGASDSIVYMGSLSTPSAGSQITITYDNSLYSAYGITVGVNDL